MGVGDVSGIAAGGAAPADALRLAYEIQEEAGEVGFDWGEVSGPLAKLHEELSEVEGAIAGGDPRNVLDEIGDLLFSVVNLARLAGVDPTLAMEGANQKFQRRFSGVLKLAGERGLPMPGTSLDELDLLWEEVKREEVKRKRDSRED